MRAADFSLVPNPASLTLSANSSSSATITVFSENNFAGTVVLSTLVAPSQGLTAFANPTNVILTAGGNATSTLMISAYTAGAYTIEVTGANQTTGPTHKTKVLVSVGDFKVDATPRSLIIPIGSYGTSVISLTSVKSFSGRVSLTASSSPGVVTYLALTSLELSPSGTNSTILTIGSGTAGPNIYAVIVTASTGVLSYTVALPVEIRPPPDFDITASTTPLTIPQGSSGTAGITLIGLNGFTGTITLTPIPPTDLTVTVSPSSVALTSVGVNAATLTVSISPSASLGTYTITVNGRAGTLIHSVTIFAIVTTAPPPAQSLLQYRYVILAGVGAAITVPILSPFLAKGISRRRRDKRLLAKKHRTMG